MKQLDHNAPYYKGVGNCEYSECLDHIAKMWKMCFINLVFMVGIFIVSCFAINENNLGLTWILGIYLGLFVSGLVDCLSVRKKFDLRMKEIKGE